MLLKDDGIVNKVLVDYSGVLSERPIRRLLFASLSGRVAFAMLPLGNAMSRAQERRAHRVARGPNPKTAAVVTPMRRL